MTRKHLIILLLLFLPVLFLGQEITYDYSVQISVGYSTYNLSDVKQHYENIIENISRYNIPIHSQIKYPGNIIWSGKFNYNLLQFTSIYFGTEYTQTSAYSFYGDYAGSIDVISNIKMYNFYIGFEQIIYQGFIFKPFFDINFGYSNISYNLEEKFNFKDYEKYNFTNIEKETFSNYKIEAGLGIKYEFTPFNLGLQTNYRISTFEGKIDNDKILEYDLSGILYKIFMQVYF